MHIINACTENTVSEKDTLSHFDATNVLGNPHLFYNFTQCLVFTQRTSIVLLMKNACLQFNQTHSENSYTCL